MLFQNVDQEANSNTIHVTLAFMNRPIRLLFQNLNQEKNTNHVTLEFMNQPIRLLFQPFLTVETRIISISTER